MYRMQRAPKWALITVLMLVLATTALAAAQSPDLHLPAGEDVGLAVKPGAAHLFATADQRRLAA